MIERHWRGVASKERTEAYLKYLEEETFPKLRELRGFVSARALTKTMVHGTEFLVVTLWRDKEAIRQFAGEAIEMAVVPDTVRKMMLRFDENAEHFDVRLQS